MIDAGTENLWGPLPEPDSTTQPSMLLAEQADFLSRETKDALKGRVDKYHSAANKLQFDLSVSVPTLNGYTYKVLRVEHDPVSIYPFRVYDIANEKEYSVDSEKKYRDVVKQILTSPEVRKVIAALRREVKGDSPSPPKPGVDPVGH